MAYIIAEPCVDMLEMSCVEECPVDCIYEGPRKRYINPAECVDCGACEVVCPVLAIFHEEDVPTEWRQYVDIDGEFFTITGLGDPGGATDVGRLETDHPAIAAVE